MTIFDSPELILIPLWGVWYTKDDGLIVCIFGEPDGETIKVLALTLAGNFFISIYYWLYCPTDLLGSKGYSGTNSNDSRESLKS